MSENHADERSAAVLLGQGGRTYLLANPSCSQVGHDDDKKRSELAMCLEGLRDNGARWRICTTPSPVCVTELLHAAWYDLRVETGDLVCAFMQADSSSQMLARPPKGQELEGWIWRFVWSDELHCELQAENFT